MVSDAEVPIGRSYLLCPHCEARINIFKSFQLGATIRSVLGLRFLKESNDLFEEHCEPGQLWKVIDLITPCPDKGLGKACELENKGKCPNQRMLIRPVDKKTVYRSCLYRKGRRVFDKAIVRAPVGAQQVKHLNDDTDDKTYRIR